MLQNKIFMSTSITTSSLVIGGVSVGRWTGHFLNITFEQTEPQIIVHSSETLIVDWRDIEFLCEDCGNSLMHVILVL